MADTPESIPQEGSNNSSSPESAFLNEAPNSAKSEDMLYNDFFQENSHGEVLTSANRERSELEIIVSILRYVTIFVVILGILAGIHVFVRSTKSGSFLENYTFLCPYLHYDIHTPDDYDKWCKNIEIIWSDYKEKERILEENIINSLATYIPIKVSSSLLDASPERKFILNTFANKPNVKNVIEAFDIVKAASQKNGNINCVGISITNGNVLSTQCEIYGGDIGDSDINWGIASSRIQALRFIENLTDTIKYSLILDAQPTSMSIEKLPKWDPSGFSTRTTLPIQVRYIPLIKKL